MNKYKKRGTTDEEQKEETTENNQSEETEEESPEVTNKRIVREDVKLKIVPTINATDIIEVKQNDEVIIIETIGDWVCIEIGTAKGWIRSDKLMTIEEKEQIEAEANIVVEEEKEEVEETTEELTTKTMYVNSTTVNVRTEASKQSSIITQISQNTPVEVLSEDNGWSKVKINENEGYIATNLLSETRTEVTTTSRASTTVREATSEGTTNTTTATTTTTSGKGATVIETAKSYIGCSYKYGATGPSSFDCSGFTSYVYKLHGVSLSRTAQAQYNNGTAVARSELQPGDLIMFGSSSSGINHVGIYIGGGQIVHAANPSRGVTTDTINSGYYNNNYVGARRVI